MDIIISANTIPNETVFATNDKRKPWSNLFRDSIGFASEEDAKTWFDQNVDLLIDNANYSIRLDTIAILAISFETDVLRYLFTTEEKNDVCNNC